MAYGLELAAWAAVPFMDAEETAQAFKNPLYSTSEAFREAVTSKLSISGDASVGLQGRPNIKANTINVHDPRSPNTIHELSVEDATGFSTVATPEELQQYADLHRDDPMALDPSLKITPRARQTQQETPKPSLFDNDKLMQMRRDQKDREAASAAAKEQRMQDLRDERSRLADERDRLNQELGL